MSNIPRVFREEEEEEEEGDERLNGMDTTVTTMENKRITRRLTQTTLTGQVLEVKCHCGRVCKNAKGLNIHQSRIKCRRGEKQRQHTAETLGEMQEDSSQEATHSTGDLSAAVPPQSHRRNSPNTTPDTESVREKVKWPPMIYNRG